MPKSIDFIEMGKEIIEGLGGPGNLKFVNHCATRIRVNVVDLHLHIEHLFFQILDIFHRLKAAGSSSL